MLSMDELLMGKKMEELDQNIQDNLPKLLEQVNKIRVLWGKPMTPTSVVRTMSEHLAIYAKKGITDKKKIPMKSKHLFGEACDIYDPDLSLTDWLKSNPQIMEDCNVFCESGNKNWVHFQIVPFGSYKDGGTRWFNP